MSPALLGMPCLRAEPPGPLPGSAWAKSLMPYAPLHFPACSFTSGARCTKGAEPAQSQKAFGETLRRHCFGREMCTQFGEVEAVRLDKAVAVLLPFGFEKRTMKGGASPW